MRKEEVYPCQVTAIKNYKINHDIVLPFRKDHPLLGEFNVELMKMKQAGVLSRLERKYNDITEKKCEEESGDSLGFDNVISPFFILGCGIILSIAILVLEMRFSFPKKLTGIVSGEQKRSDWFETSRKSCELKLRTVKEVMLAEKMNDEAKIALLKSVLFTEGEI